MRYTYCPDCGTKLILKQAGDDGLVPYCEPCQKYWFDSFHSCIIVMVVNEYNEIALLSQPHLSSIYKNFVSGYIAPGETAEECALREVKEELGIDLEELEYEGTHWFAKGGQLMHGYIGYAKKKDFTLSGEVLNAWWIPYDRAQEQFFPDSPGNTMHILFRYFLKKKGVSHGNTD